MLHSEKTIALQKYFLPKYEDLLMCMINAGGCIYHSQISMLQSGCRDSRGAKSLGNYLCEAHILKKQIMFKNTLYTPTSTALNYCGVSHLACMNNSRLKLSLLILESYIRKGYYKLENPTQAIRNRMELAGIRYYATQGQPHIFQLEHLITAFDERRLDTTGLLHQLDRMKLRVDFALSQNQSERPQIPKESDLFTLSCNTIFLSGVTMRANEYGVERPIGLIDIYCISAWKPIKMAERIIEAKRTIESILGNNSSTAFTIHSHFAENPNYKKAVVNWLSQYPEFYIEKPNLTFKWYDTAHSLFAGTNPNTLK